MRTVRSGSKRPLPAAAGLATAVLAAALLSGAPLQASTCTGPLGLPLSCPPSGSTASSVPAARATVGLVSGGDVVNEPGRIASLRPKIARVEFPISTPVSDARMRTAIGHFTSRGIRVLLLATFFGRVPSSAEAKSLGSWAAEFGPGGRFWAGRSDGQFAVRNIEFGNETSYSYQFGDDWSTDSYTQRAEEYALRFADATRAVTAANSRVGVLAQADDGGSGSSAWVHHMFVAVPQLASLVAGWTVHLYGPAWPGTLKRLVDQTSAEGASAAVPVYVTELGIATDNGRCLIDNYGWNPCMSYDQAATTLGSVVGGAQAQLGARLKEVYIFQGVDQRPSGADDDQEHYFGALRSNLTAKGGYTNKVRTLLSQ
jgi:hypothetical protein